jgi:Ca2+-binding RTX toxin-like protein
MGRRGAFALGLLAAGLAAAPADAAVVGVSGTVGPSAEEFVTYRASKGERNRVRVNIAGDDLVIVDRGVRRIRIGSDLNESCRVTSRQRAVCPNLDIGVELRDGDDTISFAPRDDGRPPTGTNPVSYLADDEEDELGEVVELASISGGTGNDRIVGTRYADYIAPGPGRDVVDARGGRDTVVLLPDGQVDRVRGGGGLDGLHHGGTLPITVDLAAGHAGAAGELGPATGFERVSGGSGDDTLLGSERTEALYGQGGSDRIDGRGGRDIVIGNDPDGDDPTPNQLAGGDGDDLIHALGESQTATTSVDCGAGADVVSSARDDRLDPSCESALLREPFDGVHSWDGPTPAWPVERAPDGSPTYEVACPSDRSGGCHGRIELEAPPGAAAASYGQGGFSVAGGTRTRVPVPLNEGGRAAVAAGQPLAVHLIGSQQGDFDVGWQQVLPR